MTSATVENDYVALCAECQVTDNTLRHRRRITASGDQSVLAERKPVQVNKNTKRQVASSYDWFRKVPAGRVRLLRHNANTMRQSHDMAVTAPNTTSLRIHISAWTIFNVYTCLHQALFTGHQRRAISQSTTARKHPNPIHLDHLALQRQAPRTTMPIPCWPGTWTPAMLARIKYLKTQGFDVYFITRYLVAEFGGPKEFDVVLRKMQEMYFLQTMGIKLGDV